MQKYFERRTYLKCPWSDVPSDPEVELRVVLPSYKEEGLLETLDFLLQLNASFKVEIIVVINFRESDTDEIKSFSTSQYESILAKYQNSDSHTIIPILLEDLPHKIAGVGLARKVGMDEAAYRFFKQKKNGVIAAFDADARCSPNFLESTLDHFKSFPKVSGASIYFEHPLNDLNSQQKKAIISYELHLRCYVNMKRYIGLPFAYQTIGSSMAVRSNEYVLKGGMNKRKAGEDFYFLQKFIEDQRFSDLTNCTVYPSARESDRVPFGTGRAMMGLKEETKPEFSSYAVQSYLDFKILVDELPKLFESTSIDITHYPEVLRQFLETQDFVIALKSIKSNSNRFESFQKRFYQWMNAFRFMKYLHFSRDNYYPNSECRQVANFLLKNNTSTKKEEFELLMSLRNIDKNKAGHNVAKE